MSLFSTVPLCAAALLFLSTGLTLRQLGFRLERRLGVGDDGNHWPQRQICVPRSCSLPHSEQILISLFVVSRRKPSLSASLPLLERDVGSNFIGFRWLAHWQLSSWPMAAIEKVEDGRAAGERKAATFGRFTGRAGQHRMRQGRMLQLHHYRGRDGALHES